MMKFWTKSSKLIEAIIYATMREPVYVEDNQLTSDFELEHLVFPDGVLISLTFVDLTIKILDGLSRMSALQAILIG